MSDSPLAHHYVEAISKIRSKGSTKVASDATWETLILPADLINRLKAMCQMVREAEMLSAKGIPVPKTLLLYGPPGTGKTQIARTLANESGVNFVSFTTADLKGQYLGQAANRVKQAFESARATSPSIIFIDEIDALTAVRGSSDALQTEALTQLLQELDGLTSKSGNVLVVAATNLLGQIDSAILSRFSQRIEICLPTIAEKTAILATLFKGRPVRVSMELAQLAEKCDGFSGRELRELITGSFNYAVERVIASGGSVQDTELTDADILRALS
jgi:transitional endoplasmic reticulum ATPase